MKQVKLKPQAYSKILLDDITLIITKINYAYFPVEYFKTK